MLQDNLYNVTSSSINQPASAALIEDYTEILDKYTVPFTKFDYYLKVGQPDKVQGWILHISVVRWQVAILLDTLLPFLKQKALAFRVVKDKEMARSILDGNLGLCQEGKIMSIYPENDQIAASVALRLIELTQMFKGPKIPTDAHLGACVYTRYGAFKPIVISNEAGKEENYIYDSKGELTKDIYYVPFHCPKDIQWPFDSISPLPSEVKSGNRGYKYRQVALLKSDSKGDVYRGVYLKRLFQPIACVIKEGRKNMWSDEFDRDMMDRLEWQMEIHTRLKGLIPIPSMLSYFRNDDNRIMILEYISGPNLIEKCFQLNSNCQSWHALPYKHKALVLDYVIQVLDIVNKIHNLGLVHRDLTPVNFLIDKKGKVFLIDNELMYDIKNIFPSPPFEGGTTGFTSPQQQVGETPATADDIYALGSTLICTLAGLTPLQINSHPKTLVNCLKLLIRSESLSHLLVDCLSINPVKRPSIGKMTSILAQYKMDISREEYWGTHPETSSEEWGLNGIIEAAIKGLVNTPTVIEGNLWYSRASESSKINGKENSEFQKTPGLFEGISGPLYVLAKLHRVGINIDACLPSYYKGWDYIEERYLREMDRLATGMYGGSAGIALAMKLSMDAGIKDRSDKNLELLYNALHRETPYLDISSGIAGQALVMLKCKDYLLDTQFEQLLTGCEERILSQVNPEGCWVYTNDTSGRKTNATSFSYGNTGIVYFLMEYLPYARHQNVEKVILKALATLSTAAKKTIIETTQKGCRVLLEENSNTLDGVQGLALIFIRAYEIFQKKEYKDIGERLLKVYPEKIIHHNYGQYTGLTGIGELYLYAFRSLKNKEWYDRAAWIAQFLCASALRGENGSVYWLAGNTKFVTADLMTGSSGILHFLVNFSKAGQLGYRLLA